MSANEINQVMDKVTQVFGLAADKVLPHLVRYTRLEGIIGLGVIVFVLVLMTIVFFMLKFEENEYGEDRNLLTFLIVFPLLYIIGLLMLSFLMKFIEPEGAMFFALLGK